MAKYRVRNRFAYHILYELSSRAKHSYPAGSVIDLKDKNEHGQAYKLEALSDEETLALEAEEKRERLKKEAEERGEEVADEGNLKEQVAAAKEENKEKAKEALKKQVKKKSNKKAK